jgi:hypothetical protein
MTVMNYNPSKERIQLSMIKVKQLGEFIKGA